MVGHSWGALLCVDYALKYPDKVEKLILISPGLDGWDYFQDTIAAQNYELRQAAIAQNNIARAAELFHQTWVVGPRRTAEEIDKEFHQKSLELIQTNMKNHWGEAWSKLDSIPAIERLSQINIPTYIIIGDQDAEDIVSIGEIYSKRIRHSLLIMPEGVAHLLNMEASADLNQILWKILKE